jgi:hypothetical protein
VILRNRETRKLQFSFARMDGFGSEWTDSATNTRDGYQKDRYQMGSDDLVVEIRIGLFQRSETEMLTD